MVLAQSPIWGTIYGVVPNDVLYPRTHIEGKPVTSFAWRQREVFRRATRRGHFGKDRELVPNAT